MHSKPVQQNYQHFFFFFFFLKFQTEKRVLRVNRSETTGESAFNGDLFEIEGKHESSKDENTWF